MVDGFRTPDSMPLLIDCFLKTFTTFTLPDWVACRFFVMTDGSA
jgi:hypothetical protein